MKAKVRGPVNNDIVLSIGMIVKNEEKHLENCLSALKKFMDQISCELIIVDTGSTDRTKEIALKYTQQVYDFEWINDFAAARNFGLNKARGKWFMFLDADEYIDEDCSQLVSFFKNPQMYEQYNSGNYIIRNYTNPSLGISTDFRSVRMTKIFPETKFEGKIHEALNLYLPTIYIDTIFHHYGYDNSDPDYIKKKQERNWPLILKELEENPDDSRAVGSVIDGCSDVIEERKYVELALKLNELPKNKTFRNANLIRSVRFYLKMNELQRVLELTDSFFEIQGNENSVSALYMYYSRAVAYAQLNDNEKAVKEFEKYLAYYKRYKDGQLDLFDMSLLCVFGCSDSEYEKININYVAALLKLRRFDEAAKHLQQFDFEKLSFDSLRSCIMAWYEILSDAKDYTKFAQLYEKILKLNDESKTELILYALELYYNENILERESFVSALAQSDVDGPYIELMRIVKADMVSEDVSTRLIEFLSKPTSWKEGYAEAIYLCLKHHIDFSALITSQGYQIMHPLIQKMSLMHTDYANQILQYCQMNILPLSLHSMFWTVSALEAAVLSPKNLYGEKLGQLYDLFVCTLSDYIYNIYNTELLNDEDVNILPDLHQFGYYMTLAFLEKNQGNDLLYVRNLRKAVASCESMKNLVLFYQKQLMDNLK